MAHMVSYRMQSQNYSSALHDCYEPEHQRRPSNDGLCVLGARQPFTRVCFSASASRIHTQAPHTISLLVVGSVVCSVVSVVSATEGDADWNASFRGIAATFYARDYFFTPFVEKVLYL